ncbi:unnamed protein product [Lampetra fluviatilis]
MPMTSLIAQGSHEVSLSRMPRRASVSGAAQRSRGDAATHGVLVSSLVSFLSSFLSTSLSPSLTSSLTT